MAIIEGTDSYRGDNLTGTSGDDFFDGKGGDDTIDGLGGTDTILIFADSTYFNISTLAGVTRIKGLYGAGDYAYDTITATNVERIEFTDTTVFLETESVHIIEGSTSSYIGDNLTGTYHFLASPSHFPPKALHSSFSSKGQFK